ncbi:hypothetical protein [Nostoc sp. MG11]|uniref:hypothetical protein n=1 Tax=Nostoc sp. MG11 TaxID=2721166 RepID=UPI001868DFC1|nr:hypothetical protein [Nostoc sp. MG11]
MQLALSPETKIYPKHKQRIYNSPALKIEAETTQNRDNIIFIVPCERSSCSLLQKYIFALLGKRGKVKGEGL